MHVISPDRRMREGKNFWHLSGVNSDCQLHLLPQLCCATAGTPPCDFNHITWSTIFFNVRNQYTCIHKANTFFLSSWTTPSATASLRLQSRLQAKLMRFKMGSTPMGWKLGSRGVFVRFSARNLALILLIVISVHPLKRQALSLSMLKTSAS